jgi:hypothetical protein
MSGDETTDSASLDDDSVVLYPGTTGKWLVLALFLFGCAAGIALLWEDPLKAIVAVAFFGILAVLMIAQLWPGLVYLKLSPLGFEVKNVRQRFFVKWSDVESFSIARVGKGKYVAFRLVESLRPKRSTVSWLLVPKDVDGILPFGLGFDLNDLLCQMNAWHKRATESRTPHVGQQGAAAEPSHPRS